MKIIVILSGGLDSTTMLYDFIKHGHEVAAALTFNYGQKHKKEINYAKKTCKKLKLKHKIIDLSSITQLLNSSLTTNQEIPEGHYKDENMKSTVVPFRNTIMLSVAAAYASSLKVNYVAYAAHGGDHAIYPDCRPEFVDKINQLFSVADYIPVKVSTPYLNLSKADIVKEGLELNVPYEDTWTCYKGRKKACGKCGSCVERLEAFKENNVKDPLKYENN
jgi:7-cyano-7-deazaguanine synthase